MYLYLTNHAQHIFLVTDNIYLFFRKLIVLQISGNKVVLEGNNKNDFMLLDKWETAYVTSMHVAVVVHKYNKLNPQS